MEARHGVKKENKKAILRKSERAMCALKVVDEKTTKEQMDVLGLKASINRSATANRVRWYRHELRRDIDRFLRAALDLEVSGKRKRGLTKKPLEASGRGDKKDLLEGA